MKQLSILFVLLLTQGAIQSQDLYDKIDKRMLNHRSKNKIPGMAYGISIDGKIVHQKAIGIADLRHNVPVKNQSVFNLASVTKQFTAAALVLLEQEGQFLLN